MEPEGLTLGEALDEGETLALGETDGDSLLIAPVNATTTPHSYR